MVDSEGIEPSTPGCKAGVFPLALAARKMEAPEGVEPPTRRFEACRSSAELWSQDWCREWESNPHDFSAAASSRRCVYHFTIPAKQRLRRETLISPKGEYLRLLGAIPQRAMRQTLSRTVLNWSPRPESNWRIRGCNPAPCLSATRTYFCYSKSAALKTPTVPRRERQHYWSFPRESNPDPLITKQGFSH